MNSTEVKVKPVQPHIDLTERRLSLPQLTHCSKQKDSRCRQCIKMDWVILLGDASNVSFLLRVVSGCVHVSWRMPYLDQHGHICGFLDVEEKLGSGIFARRFFVLDKRSRLLEYFTDHPKVWCHLFFRLNSQFTRHP